MSRPGPFRTVEQVGPHLASGSRALVVVDLVGRQAQGWDADEFAERFDRQRAAALRRAGIDRQHDLHVSATSLDAVSRDPLRVPWGIYPIHPIAAARLIGDVSIAFRR